MRTQGCILKQNIQFGSDEQPAKSAKAKFSKLVNMKWSKCTKFKLFYKVLNAGTHGHFDICYVFPPGLPELTKMVSGKLTWGVIRGERNGLKISCFSVRNGSC